ncbi:unnamed protein product [Angiostrongylus costaricensis]|uniref:Histone domain-containing protein n=1 Tax=Angiostrongylus costaricensis TaxID=334426 RepID=A0A0R3PZ45_ANGCS|nr:unnamed protein product [Angiostrongylus costaricensis]
MGGVKERGQTRAHRSGQCSLSTSFVNDLFERVAAEASRLAQYNKRLTISSRETDPPGRTREARRVRENQGSDQVHIEQVDLTRTSC